MKTVNDLINELQALKPELREKPVYVIAENGLLMEAKVKFGVYDYTDVLNRLTDKIIITYD